MAAREAEAHRQAVEARAARLAAKEAARQAVEALKWRVAYGRAAAEAAARCQPFAAAAEIVDDILDRVMEQTCQCCICFNVCNTFLPMCVAHTQHACPTCVLELRRMDQVCALCRAPLLGHVHPEPEPAVEVLTQADFAASLIPHELNQLMLALMSMHADHHEEDTAAFVEGAPAESTDAASRLTDAMARLFELFPDEQWGAGGEGGASFEDAIIAAGHAIGLLDAGRRREFDAHVDLGAEGA